MGNTRPECFLRGLKFSDKKIRGLKLLGENLRGLRSISKFDQFFYFHFLEDTDPNIAKIVTISEIRKGDKIKIGSFFNWVVTCRAKGCEKFSEKLYQLKIGFKTKNVYTSILTQLFENIPTTFDLFSTVRKCRKMSR